MYPVRVYSAGSNAHGQLAHDSKDDSCRFKQCIFHGLDNPDLAGSKIMSIATGANHTLLLLRTQDSASQLWGAGNGQRGQLGAQYRQELGASSVFHRIFPGCNDARLIEFTAYDMTLIAASWEASYVALSGSDNDLLLSVGSDDFGDLGIGGLRGGQKETDVWRIVGFRHLVPKKASNIRISQLKAGPHNVIAKLSYLDANMREAQLMVGWGAARQGQLGQGPTSKKLPSTYSSPNIIHHPSHISAFAVGNQHTVLLTSQGTVFPLGSNKKGQLSGLGAVRNACSIATTWNGTYLLVKHENANRWVVLATGSNSSGQLARSPIPDVAVASSQLNEISLPVDASEATSLDIICGSEHVLLFSRSGAQAEVGGVYVYVWGWNEHGNLGLGHTHDVHEPARLQIPNDHPCQEIVGIWAGCATTWIVVEQK